MRYEIGELTIGKILDQGIALMKNHFAMLLGITAAMLIPLNLVMNFSIIWLVPQFSPQDPKQLTHEEVHQLIVFLTSVVGIVLAGLLAGLSLVYPLTHAAIIQAVACEYLDQPISIGAAYRRAARILFPLLGTVFIAYLAILPGLCCCYVPGLVLTLLFSLATPIVVIEGLYFIPALKRSWRLMQGNLLTGFLLWLILVLIQTAIGAMGNLLPQRELGAVVNSVLGAVGFVIHSAVWVVFYFSCRSKSEHFDLTMLADAVGRDDPDLPQLEVDN